MLLYSQFPR